MSLIALKQIKRSHDPSVVAIFDICKSTGYSGCQRVEAQGFSGGIRLLWDSHEVNLVVLEDNQQYIHSQVQHGNEKCCWWTLTQFSRLRKSGGSSCTINRSSQFMRWINDLELLDLSFSGSPFTWSRGNNIRNCLMCRIDRSVSNIEWKHQWPEASVRHLHKFSSDHTPLLFSVTGYGSVGEKHYPFRFQAAWLSHNSFRELLHNHWNHSDSLRKSLRSLIPALNQRNKEVFGYVSFQKKCLLARIAGVNRAMKDKPSNGMFALERWLSIELEEVRNQEELVWIHEGECNMRFFHTTALVRRRCNCIESSKKMQPSKRVLSNSE